MSVWDRLRAIFRREAREVRDMVDGAVDRGHAALDRKEREQAASPEERLRMQQERAAQSDAEFDEVRRRIERGD